MAVIGMLIVVVVFSIANLLGVSPGTLYNHIPDLQELRDAGRKAQLPAPAN